MSPSWKIFNLQKSFHFPSWILVIPFSKFLSWTPLEMHISQREIRYPGPGNFPREMGDREKILHTYDQKEAENPHNAFKFCLNWDWK